MRTSLALGLAGLSLLLAPAPARADGSGAPPAKKVENPWKAMPKGTVLEFKTASDETWSNKKGEVKHTEGSETWTLLENDGKVATIEVTSGAEKKKIQRDLSPVDEPLQPPVPDPSGATGGAGIAGGPDGQDHPTADYDQIATPFGTYNAIRIDHRMVMLEGGSDGQEWLVEGIPEPVKWTRRSSGGAGVVRTQTDTRTMVRFARPDESWTDYPIGSALEVQVDKEHRVDFPKGQEPKIEKSTELWILTKRDDKLATFDVKTGDKTEQRTLPLTLGSLPGSGAADKEGAPGDRISYTVTRELLPTFLGKLPCWHIRRHMAANEMGGASEEWRVAGFPFAFKTSAQWGHKQQVDTETRTVTRIGRAK